MQKSDILVEQHIPFRVLSIPGHQHPLSSWRRLSRQIRVEAPSVRQSMASIQCGFGTLLDRKYQRNNKDTGQKNLRCFPNCDRTRGHIIHGYCGTFVNIFVKGESPGARLHAWAIFGLYRDPPDVRIGDVRKLQDIRSKLERGRGNPGRPWIPGERTESGFQFNRNRQGWHYGWTSSVHTSDSAHVLRAYVFEEMPNVEGHIRCVGYAESSEFRVYCSRRRPRGASKAKSSSSSSSSSSSKGTTDNAAHSAPTPAPLPTPAVKASQASASSSLASSSPFAPGQPGLPSSVPYLPPPGNYANRLPSAPGPSAMAIGLGVMESATSLRPSDQIQRLSSLSASNQSIASSSSSSSSTSSSSSSRQHQRSDSRLPFVPSRASGASHPERAAQRATSAPAFPSGGAAGESLSGPSNKRSLTSRLSSESSFTADTTDRKKRPRTATERTPTYHQHEKQVPDQQIPQQSLVGMIEAMRAPIQSNSEHDPDAAARQMYQLDHLQHQSSQHAAQQRCTQSQLQQLLQQFSSAQQQQVPPQSQSQPRPFFQHNTGHASASLAQMSQLQAQGGMTQPMNTFPDLQNASWAHQHNLPPNDQYQQPQNNRPEQSVAMFQQLVQNNPGAMAAFAYAAAGLGLWPAQTTTSGIGSHLGASYQPRRPSALLPQEEPPHDLQQERARQNLQGFSSASNLNISSMGVAYTRASPAAPEVPPIDESEPRGHLVRANATKSPHSPPPGSQAANPGHTQGVSSSLRPFNSSGSATWSSNMGNNNSNDAEND